MLVQASHGPRIFALLLSSDGWTGQVLLASGAIVFTSFGRNLKKKMHALSLFGMHWPCLQLGAQETTRVFTGVHTRAPHGPFVSAHIPWMFQQHTVLYLPSQSTFFFLCKLCHSFSDMAASNGFVDRLMQAHVTSFQHWLKSPDTPFVHSQCHECLEHPAV